METRRLGNSTLDITSIGFGSWAAGGGGWLFGWGAQDDRESIDAIIRAVDQGINWIDTAPVYGLGHSEEVVGKALKELSERPLIASKLGRVWDDAGNIGGNLRPESVRRECEDSLRRLDIDTIDLYQVHWPKPDVDIEDCWGTIAELVEEGKVRFAGVSNFSPSQMDRCRAIHPVASLQPPYNMLRRQIEAELLPYCEQHDIGVICYSPMQKGLLTGKYTFEKIAALPDDDHRQRDPLFTEPRLSAVLDLVEKLRAVADRNSRTLAQLAIAWTLRRPEVTAAIVGARRPEQVTDTIQAGDWHLGEDDIAEIDGYIAAYDSATA
jgi:aryl-alcohol dehydrogenase-like predicted oxidoreductase